jgi:acyl-CoA dehydrogenase
VGDLFTLVVYGGLVLEQVQIEGVGADLVDQIFDLLVRDFSAAAIELHGRASSTEAQQQWALDHVRKSVVDDHRFTRVWDSVRALAGAYEMAP